LGKIQDVPNDEDNGKLSVPVRFPVINLTSGEARRQSQPVKSLRPSTAWEASVSEIIQRLCQAIFILCILLAATFERATAQPNFGMDIKVVKQ
jgi:hypothetical protein